MSNSHQSSPQKVALVTGGAGGIGRAVCERLGKDGFTVVVNYSGGADKANEIVDGIRSAGGTASAAQADVTDLASVAALFQRTLNEHGEIDVVVHCAGISPMSPIVDGDVALFDQVIDVNLRGTFLLFCEAAKHVADGGRIIAFSSSVLAKSFPNYGPYIASKAGVEGLVHVLANELGKRHVTVNAVSPGPVVTSLFMKGKTQDTIDHLAQLAPLGRLGQPEDIASAVSFLAGPDGAWVNSQVLRVNGGFV